MVGNDLSRTRRRVAYVMTVGLSLGLAWAATPGLPILWEPRASAEAKAGGLALFEHEWQVHDPIAQGDGLGPVFNGKSCVGCHFQGGVGGGGANQHNVVSFELLPTKERPTLKGGLIHAFAVENKFTEKLGTLKSAVPGHPRQRPARGELPGPWSMTSTRSGPSRSTRPPSSAPGGSTGSRARRSTSTGSARPSRPGRPGAERASSAGSCRADPGSCPDGRIGKFGWKAQFASLEDFVAAACANEIGLGNPVMEQAKPIGHDYPSVPADLDRKQFRSPGRLRRYPLPARRGRSPPTPAEAFRTRRGARPSSAKVGCASCHTPDIGGLELVYSDFLLHRLDDRIGGGDGLHRARAAPQVPLPEAFPLPEEWKTPPLWGVADSAPYFHDGASKTLEAAIARHHGNAEPVRESYSKLSTSDQQAVVAFLKTLKAPTDARPAVLHSAGSLASSR